MSNFDNIDKICAIIISYNGLNDLPTTISRVLEIVEKVIIIDNCSIDGTVDYLSQLTDKRIEVIFHNKNLGIAKALNNGVLKAKSFGFNWVLTLDQDSYIHTKMIDEFIKCYNTLIDNEQEKLALIAPRIIHLDYDENISIYTDPNIYKNKNVVITSGNLINTNKVMAIGGFEDKLFIDSVDFDMCLRLKAKNFTIIECRNAFLFHKLGEKKRINFFLFSFYLRTHSPIRKYYISRNTIYIVKKYFFKNTLFCLEKLFFFVGFIFQSILFEDKRFLSVKNIYLGIKDGILNNYGEFNNKTKEKKI